MLKHLLFLSLAALTFASCKKDNDNKKSEYFLTAKIDGVKKEFNNPISAIRVERSPNGIIVTGRSDERTTTIFPALTLMLNDHTALTARTYTAGADPIGAGYSITTMAPYNSDTNFSVTITAISATEIKGSFSGKVKDEAGTIVDISEGLFSAKIQ